MKLCIMTDRKGMHKDSVASMAADATAVPLICKACMPHGTFFRSETLKLTAACGVKQVVAERWAGHDAPMLQPGMLTDRLSNIPGLQDGCYCPQRQETHPVGHTTNFQLKLSTQTFNSCLWA